MFIVVSYLFLSFLRRYLDEGVLEASKGLGGGEEGNQAKYKYKYIHTITNTNINTWVVGRRTWNVRQKARNKVMNAVKNENTEDAT